MPRVSVLLPVFNGARYLDESIASIVAQTFDDFELIAIDDGSTDETPAMLERWAQRDPRVIVVRLDANGGTPRALNAGLAMARGEYIARQDADDVSAPERLAKEVALLDRRPEVVLALMTYVHVDAEGAVLTKPKRAESPAVLAFLNHVAPILGVPGQSMLRTEAARAIGGWDESFQVAQGWELFTRICRRGAVAMLPDVGMYYRVHPARMSVVNSALQVANAIKIARRELTHFLGRDVAPEEAEAIWRVFMVRPLADAAPAANRLMREALAKFARDADREDVARVRELVASRFTRSAAALALRGRIVGAAQHLAMGLRWRRVPR